MVFAAYDGREKVLSFEGRDEAAGILGTFHPGEDPPIATADTYDQLELKAWAYIGHEPSAFLYLADDEYRIYGVLNNKKGSAALSKIQQKNTIITIVLVFCVTCLVAASLGSFGIWALVAFMGALVLYGLLLVMGMNKIEVVVPIECMLIAFFFVIPTIQRYYDHSHKHRDRGGPLTSDSLRPHARFGTANEVSQTSKLP